MATSISLNERQEHEAEVYDARAGDLSARLSDEDLVVAADHPPYPNREHVDFLDALMVRAGDLEGRRVLEVGCGSGALGVYLALQGASVTGVDVSDPMLDLARRRANVNGVGDQTNFVRTPVERFDEPDASFDFIIANQVLHHLELGEAMPNIARLIGDRGVALFIEPVLMVPEWLRRSRYHPFVLRVFPSRRDTPDERSLDATDLALIASSFTSSEISAFQLATRLQNFVELPDSLFNVFQRFDRAALRRIPAARTLARYVLLELRGRSDMTGENR